MTEHQRQIMNDYLCELKAARVRISSHKSPVEMFFRWVRDTGVDFLCLRIRDAQNFQQYLAVKTDGAGAVHYRAVSVSTLVDRIRRFYEYLRVRKLVRVNPFNEIYLIKRKKTLPRNILNEEEMSKFLHHLRDFRKGLDLNERRRLYRAHVIAELLYSTGARINEVMKITRDDIDFSRGTVTVHDDKTRKSRECILNEYAAKVMRIYIDEMREYAFFENNIRSGALFGAHAGLVTWLNKIVTSESMKCGYSKVTSHHFRHAVGFHLLRAGCDIRYIKEILGHEDLGTTQVYTKVDKADLKKVIDRFHPRSFGAYDEKL